MPLGTCFPRSRSVPTGLGYGFSESGRNSATGLWEVQEDAGYPKSCASSAPRLPKLPPSRRCAPAPERPQGLGAHGKGKSKKHLGLGVSQAPPRSVETEQLLLEISFMKQHEVEQTGQRVLKVVAVGGQESREVVEAFTTRVAEILCRLKSSELSLAKPILELMQGLTKGDTLVRTLEQRICVLSHSVVEELEDLMCCRDTAADLRRSQILGSKAYEVAMDCLHRWIDKVPLRDIRKQIGNLAALTAAERKLLFALEQRLAKQAAMGLSGPGQLRNFAQLLLQLKDGGVKVLQGARRPVIDTASGELLPLLQVATLGPIRDTLKHWSMEKLVVEFSGPVLRLMNECPTMKPQALAAIAARTVEGLEQVTGLFERRSDPVRVQQELYIWTQFVRQVGEAGLLLLSETKRREILAAPKEPGSLAYCMTSITPGAPQFPPEYFPRAAPLRTRHAEVEQAVEHVRLLVRGATENPQPWKPPTVFEEDEGVHDAANSAAQATAEQLVQDGLGPKGGDPIDVH